MQHFGENTYLMMTELTYLQLMEINLGHIVLLKLHTVLRTIYYLVVIQKQTEYTHFHKLNIEEGRHRKLSLQERICQLCKVEVEDGKHFVMYCSELEACRKAFFDKVNDICPMFNSMDTSDKFKFMIFLLFCCNFHK